MIQLIVLIGVAGGIASFARGRGGSPWFWSGAAVLGYLVLFIVGSIAVGDRYPIGVSLTAWAWVALVALYTRFILGRGRAGASGTWVCTQCKTMNRSYALQCDACGEPYGKT